jgi:hypothetical protein
MPQRDTSKANTRPKPTAATEGSPNRKRGERGGEEGAVARGMVTARAMITDPQGMMREMHKSLREMHNSLVARLGVAVSEWTWR